MTFLKKKLMLSNLKNLKSKGMKMKMSLSEATLYIKGDDIKLIIISLNVDDFLDTGNNDEFIKKFKDDM
ncbi:retrovirus-related Pol polyprotein from transposon TNT 1-94 [Gossypium australe]|uniref:Retrovirus-related Pol polyprotein from transposon TNT 1-94 n=1 Tax=Gossypium australe TaxID=47621 RepID=A0A5B6VEE7_9ROSI|nr:retrovirus-related Pol polyprotein from transposon TNT 1-94 [Gossypium australe]